MSSRSTALLLFAPVLGWSCTPADDTTHGRREARDLNAEDDGGTLDGGQSAGLQVSVAASDATPVCAGQCVTLTADAQGGVGPYTFTWDHGLAMGPGPLSVCPTETKTYRVLVSDSAETFGEFAQNTPDVARSVTVQVSAVCDDAHSGPGKSCTKRFPVNGKLDPYKNEYPRFRDWEGYNKASMDSQGAAVWTGALQGDVDFGGGLFTRRGVIDTYLVKYDDQCNHRWSKLLGAPDIRITPGSLAVDDEDNIVLVGSYSGTGAFDLGDGGFAACPAGAYAEKGFVAKYGSDGDLLWSRCYAADTMVESVGLDAAKNVYITGFGSPGCPFGTDLDDRDSASYTPSFRWVVKLDPTGEVIWSRATYWVERTTLVTKADGTSFVAGVSQRVQTWGKDEFQLGNNEDEYLFLARFTSDGQISWLRATDDVSTVASAASEQIALSLDPGGDLLTFGQWRTDASDDALFTAGAFDPVTGARRWLRNLTSDGIDGAVGVGGSAPGHTFVTSGFVARVTSFGTPLQSVGLTDRFIFELDAQGQVQRSLSVGTAQADWGLGFAASKHALVLTGATEAADDALELFLERIELGD